MISAARRQRLRQLLILGGYNPLCGISARHQRASLELHGRYIRRSSQGGEFCAISDPWSVSEAGRLKRNQQAGNEKADTANVRDWCGGGVVRTVR
jgi:hypothetical protein